MACSDPAQDCCFVVFFFKDENGGLVCCGEGRGGVHQSDNTQLISEVQAYWTLKSVFPYLTWKSNTPKYCQYH